MNEPAEGGRFARLLAAVFCDTCRITYVPPTEHDASCPQCGSTPSLDAPTVELSALESGRVSARESLELDALLGQELGVYYLETLLGAGAMGRVYLARHRDLHRSCALKILPPELVKRDPQYVNRFMDEGRAAAALIHPNVITVHAIGEQRGFHFLEMEFVAGQSLKQLVSEDGAQPPERATALAARIAEGLSAAHSEGLLHRDLKLDNILLSHQGVPKIADFGLAKRVVINPDAFGAPDIVGTPHYMAPELFDGAHATPASDVYALGVCYYILLTGRFPFPGSSVSEIMRAAQYDPLPNPRQFSPDLTLEMAESLHLMLSKTPSNRPVDAHGASQLLQAVLGQYEDLETLLLQAFEGHAGVSWVRTGEEFVLKLEFASGRKQKVWVAPSQHAAAERLLTISSLCARADAEHYEMALRLNSEIQHGALAIREIQGIPYFVMLNSYPRATVDAEEIRRSVLEVAHRADALERLLTDGDVN